MECFCTGRLSAPCLICGHRDERVHIVNGATYCGAHCRVCSGVDPAGVAVRQVILTTHSLEGGRMSQCRQ
jgi:hypothetical protein